MIRAHRVIVDPQPASARGTVTVSSCARSTRSASCCPSSGRPCRPSCTPSRSSATGRASAGAQLPLFDRAFERRADTMLNRLRHELASAGVDPRRGVHRGGRRRHRRGRRRRRRARAADGRLHARRLHQGRPGDRAVAVGSGAVQRLRPPQAATTSSASVGSPTSSVPTWSSCRPAAPCTCAACTNRGASAWSWRTSSPSPSCCRSAPTARRAACCSSPPRTSSSHAASASCSGRSRRRSACSAPTTPPSSRRPECGCRPAADRGARLDGDPSPFRARRPHRYRRSHLAPAGHQSPKGTTPWPSCSKPTRPDPTPTTSATTVRRSVQRHQRPEVPPERPLRLVHRRDGHALAGQVRRGQHAGQRADGGHRRHRRLPQAGRRHPRADRPGARQQPLIRCPPGARHHSRSAGPVPADLLLRPGPCRSPPPPSHCPPTVTTPTPPVPHCSTISSPAWPRSTSGRRRRCTSRSTVAGEHRQLRAAGRTAARWSIGRSADADVVVAVAQASRRHAELRSDRRPVSCHDAGSSYGTWVERDGAAPATCRSSSPPATGSSPPVTSSSSRWSRSREHVAPAGRRCPRPAARRLRRRRGDDARRRPRSRPSPTPGSPASRSRSPAARSATTSCSARSTSSTAIASAAGGSVVERSAGRRRPLRRRRRRARQRAARASSPTATADVRPLRRRRRAARPVHVVACTSPSRPAPDGATLHRRRLDERHDGRRRRRRSTDAVALAAGDYVHAGSSVFTVVDIDQRDLAVLGRRGRRARLRPPVPHRPGGAAEAASRRRGPPTSTRRAPAPTGGGPCCR